MQDSIPAGVTIEDVRATHARRRRAATLAQTPVQPRFVAGFYFGVQTVCDTEADMVVVHQAPWDEDMAAFVAAELSQHPQRVALFDWEERVA